MAKNKELLTVIGAVLVAIAILVVASLTTSCSFRWSKPDNGMTLEQRGVLVNLAAKNAIVQLRRNEPGEWEDYVCSLATIVVDALNGDDESIARLNTVLSEPLSIDKEVSIPMKALLLDLLNLTVERFDLHGWESTIADGITVFDAFVLSGVTTDYEVWYLTREFFAGINAGCAVIIS